VKNTFGEYMKLIIILCWAISFSLIAANKDSISKGKLIYDSVCFACHGKNLEGATGHKKKFEKTEK